MKPVLWAAAITLLALCVRINYSHSVDPRLFCASSAFNYQDPESGCEEMRNWSISLKWPWKRW